MATPLFNSGFARIDPRKLRDYPLDLGHPVGRFKAEFLSAMGYGADNWQRLESDIRTQHLVLPADEGKASPHGRKYTITAQLTGPNGMTRQVTTVWIFRGDNDFAELVTLEPAARLIMRSHG